MISCSQAQEIIARSCSRALLAVRPDLFLAAQRPAHKPNRENLEFLCDPASRSGLRRPIRPTSLASCGTLRAFHEPGSWLEYNLLLQPSESSAWRKLQRRPGQAASG